MDIDHDELSFKDSPEVARSIEDILLLQLANVDKQTDLKHDHSLPPLIMRWGSVVVKFLLQSLIAYT